METNQNEEFVQLFMLGGGLLNKHLEKVLSKYLQWDSNKDQLSLFSL